VVVVVVVVIAVVVIVIVVGLLVMRISVSPYYVVTMGVCRQGQGGRKCCRVFLY